MNPLAPWVITSNGTPGTIRARYRLEDENGRVYSSAPVTIVVKDYPQVNLRYMAFIECKVVPGFELLQTGLVWGGGDNRGYSPNATSWRARVDHTFRARDVDSHATTSALTTNPPVFGLSTLYWPWDVQAPATPNWPFECGFTTSGLPQFAATLPLREDWASFKMRRRPQSSTVDALVLVRAENPFSAWVAPAINLLPITHPTPPIRAVIPLLLEFKTDPNTGDQRVIVKKPPNSVHGPTEIIRSAFPAHELYIMGEPLMPFMYSHTNHGTVVANLENINTVTLTEQGHGFPLP